MLFWQRPQLPVMSLSYSAQTSTALAAGMIIRARTPSLIMQGDVQVPIQAIRRPEAAGGLWRAAAPRPLFCTTTPRGTFFGAFRAAHTQPCMH